MRKRSLIVLPLLAGLIVACFVLKGRGAPPRPPSKGKAEQSSPTSSAGPYEARPKPPLPEASTARGTRDVPSAFSALLARHTEADKLLYRGGRARFALEEAMGLREGRLLALVHPEQIIPLAVALALDPNRDYWDRAFAVRLLGYLASERHAGGMSALIQLANQYSNEKALSFDTKNLANDT